MKLSEGVEWALHCCAVLATLPEDATLPAAKLAELHELPPAYLAKHLQALAAAGITTSLPGPTGGYRLARAPSDISMLEVVHAIEGDDTAFRCTEIRQRGPAAGGPDAYPRACGIARAMWRAEGAWRAELSSTSIGDLVMDLVRTVQPELLAAGATWVGEVQRRRTKR